MNLNIPTTIVQTIPDNYTYWFQDNPQIQSVNVFINNSNVAFPIWTGSAYLEIGDYTQEQVDLAVYNYINSVSSSV